MCVEINEESVTAVSLSQKHSLRSGSAWEGAACMLLICRSVRPNVRACYTEHTVWHLRHSNSQINVFVSRQTHGILKTTAPGEIKTFYRNSIEEMAVKVWVGWSWCPAQPGLNLRSCGGRGLETEGSQGMNFLSLYLSLCADHFFFFFFNLRDRSQSKPFKREMSMAARAVPGQSQVQASNVSSKKPVPWAITPEAGAWAGNQSQDFNMKCSYKCHLKTKFV